MSSVTPSATAFTTSYAHAVALGHNPSSLPLCATAMSTHYTFPLTAFTLGQTHSIPSLTSATAGTLSHLEKLGQKGVGTEISMVRSTVKEVGVDAAVVFITWEIKDARKGKEASWRWRNAYGYRRSAGEKGVRVGGDGEDGWEVPEGRWEYVVSDEEIGELVKRCPEYFEA